jgi:RecB family endonuclease NucS
MEPVELVDQVSTENIEITKEALLDNIEIKTSEKLVKAIKEYQSYFADLNSRLELVVKGFIIGKDIDIDQYKISFSEDLSTITLNIKTNE